MIPQRYVPEWKTDMKNRNRIIQVKNENINFAYLIQIENFYYWYHFCFVVRDL